MNAISPGLMAEIAGARAIFLSAPADQRKRNQLNAWTSTIGPYPGVVMTDREFVVHVIAALTLELEERP